MAKLRVWTIEEEEFVIANYGKMTIAEIGKKIGKTTSQVTGKIAQLRKQRRMPLPRATSMRFFEPEGNGLDLSAVKLTLNKTYKIISLTEENTKYNNLFVGKFEQETDRHLTFRCKHGYCQSFLKVDILIGNVKVVEEGGSR